MRLITFVGLLYVAQCINPETFKANTDTRGLIFILFMAGYAVYLDTKSNKE